ncbi:MAG: GntR family transcriptional regulator [Paracoccaceae bacterium]
MTKTSIPEAGAGLQSDQAQEALFKTLQQGVLKSGQFLSMNDLVDLLGYPLAAVREAVKGAGALGLVTILPKRGVQVMGAGPEVTRDCMDLRQIFDQEGARRLIGSGRALNLDELRRSHDAVLMAARKAPSSAISALAIRTDLSLHDFIAAGLDNPLAQRSYAINRIRIAIVQNTRPFLHDRIVSAMEEHLAIMEALEARAVGRVEEAIAYHYRQTLVWWGVYV